LGSETDFEPESADADLALPKEKPRDSGASPNARGWFRTTDLSRVKREKKRPGNRPNAAS
jgi:hypothetical protein